MNILSEQVIVSTLQPVAPREYVKFGTEYSPTVPNFPFPFHIRHDGEPLYPRILRSDDHPHLASEKGQEGFKWMKWMYQQPDWYLLFFERSVFERIQHTRFEISQKELEQIKQQWFDAAQELREQGHGEVLDIYWPHVAKFTPLDK